MSYARCIGRVGALAVALGIGIGLAALRTTASHHPITRGLAYPKYYRALVPDLKELTAWAKQARDTGPEMWASDSTTTEFDVLGLDSIRPATGSCYCPPAIQRPGWTPWWTSTTTR
jgi:hypothetical protein